MIVKLQVDSTGTQVLIYNKSHSTFYQASGVHAAEIINLFDLQPLSKIYAYATVSKAGVITFSGKVKIHEDW